MGTVPGAASPSEVPRPPQAQLIAQSIGQAFSVAYQEFLRANGINPEDLSQKEYSDLVSSQEMYNDDLVHFSNSDNCKEVRLRRLPPLLLPPLLLPPRSRLWARGGAGDAARTTSVLRPRDGASAALPVPARGC